HGGDRRLIWGIGSPNIWSAALERSAAPAPSHRRWCLARASCGQLPDAVLVDERENRLLEFLGGAVDQLGELAHLVAGVLAAAADGCRAPAPPRARGRP